MHPPIERRRAHTSELGVVQADVERDVSDRAAFEPTTLLEAACRFVEQREHSLSHRRVVVEDGCEELPGLVRMALQCDRRQLRFPAREMMIDGPDGRFAVCDDLLDARATEAALAHEGLRGVQHAVSCRCSRRHAATI